jgi:hypothetical protein
MFNLMKIIAMTLILSQIFSLNIFNTPSLDPKTAKKFEAKKDVYVAYHPEDPVYVSEGIQGSYYYTCNWYLYDYLYYYRKAETTDSNDTVSVTSMEKRLKELKVKVWKNENYDLKNVDPKEYDEGRLTRELDIYAAIRLEKSLAEIKAKESVPNKNQSTVQSAPIKEGPQVTNDAARAKVATDMPSTSQVTLAPIAEKAQANSNETTVDNEIITTDTSKDPESISNDKKNLRTDNKDTITKSEDAKSNGTNVESKQDNIVNKTTTDDVKPAGNKVQVRLETVENKKENIVNEKIDTAKTEEVKSTETDAKKRIEGESNQVIEGSETKGETEQQSENDTVSYPETAKQ